MKDFTVIGTRGGSDAYSRLGGTAKAGSCPYSVPFGTAPL